MIIAVDPGKMCGLIAIRQTGEVYCRLEQPALNTCNRLFEMIHQIRPIALVVERYTITPRVMSQQTDALEVIGALRWMCARDSGVAFTLQSRSDRVRVTNEMLVQLDLWTPRDRSPGGHINEAARHAVVYITRAFPQHPIAKRLLSRVAVEANSSNGVASDGLRGAS